MHAAIDEEPSGSEADHAEEVEGMRRAGSGGSRGDDMASQASSEALAMAADGGGTDSFDEDRALAAAAQRAELEQHTPTKQGSGSGRGWARPAQHHAKEGGCAGAATACRALGQVMRCLQLLYAITGGRKAL